MDAMDNDFVGVCGKCKRVIETHHAVAFTSEGLTHLVCPK